MTRAELKEQLEQVAPVYYDFAPVNTPLPFITFHFDSDNFAADNKVYQRIASVTVNHYHEQYDNGAAIKTVLDENELFWECVGIYDADQKLYIDTYTMEVLEDG